MTPLIANARTWGEMTKFSHSLFALPYALLAAFMAAGGPPAAGQLALVVVCMVGARSAAMTFNRLVDAEIDAHNPRTAGRPLPAGQISRGAAWGFFAGSSALFLAGCALFALAYANPWPLVLSPPVLAVVCGYSYAKRFTRAAHFVLGAAIGFSPLAAWIAISPETLGWPAIWLSVAVTFWIAGFDLIYACQDVEFDRRHGLFSVPAQMGVAAALWMARGCHVLTVAALLAAGRSAALGTLYFVGVGCVALLLLIENALVSPRDLSRVNLAFFTVNGVVGVLLGTLGVLDICLP
ncbi:MAG TPA: UbiA-like polyprenyltransferase [Phycisphaerae bacterium]|nr:UbiA-like polyprenyltransferase [Phycisphaerae bacterium]